jgi:hypothetical protein
MLQKQGEKQMICISLKENISCEHICKEIKKYVEKNIKSQEQANNAMLKITLVEPKDDIQTSLIES